MTTFNKSLIIRISDAIAEHNYSVLLSIIKPYGMAYRAFIWNHLPERQRGLFESLCM